MRCRTFTFCCAEQEAGSARESRAVTRRRRKKKLRHMADLGYVGYDRDEALKLLALRSQRAVFSKLLGCKCSTACLLTSNTVRDSGRCSARCARAGSARRSVPRRRLRKGRALTARARVDCTHLQHADALHADLCLGVTPI